nr:glycosyltransferase [Prosthecomicrobium pneumaticum]
MSPHFPPSSLAGVHRARHLAKHLPAHGWRPIIVRVDERHYPEVPDRALAALVPETVEQIRTGAVPARLARFAGIGDIGLRGYPFFGRALAEAAARFEAQLVLITGSPYYPMLLAAGIRRRLRLPVVLDFQDPWVSADGATRPWPSKGRLAHQLAVALEPRAVKAAAWITSVSETQNAEMAARYPWLDARRMTAIPIGGDAEDFAALRAAPAGAADALLEPGRINLCYVGTFLPHGGAVMRTLFRAVGWLAAHHPAAAERLRLVFVGTSNQPAGTATGSPAHRVARLAEEEGVAALVREHPARVPFVDALTLLARSDGVMMLGSDEPHYTASKIYPGLMSGRPWLSIFHARSSAHAILTEAGGGAAFGFSDPAALPGLVPALGATLLDLVEAPGRFGQVDPAAYAPYSAHAVAGRFAAVFEAAS